MPYGSTVLNHVPKENPKRSNGIGILNGTRCCSYNAKIKRCDPVHSAGDGNKYSEIVWK